MESTGNPGIVMKSVPSLRNAAQPLGPYSHAVVANGLVFISGQVPLKPGSQPGDWAGKTIADQTRQCVRNIETILKELGATLEDVVKVTVYLADPGDYRAMNEAYREFFPSEPPARSVARIGAEPAGLLISVDAVAVQPAH